MQIRSFSIKIAAIAAVGICICSLHGVVRADTVPAAAIVSANGPYTLICKYTVGKTSKYAMSITNQMSGVAGSNQAMNMVMDMNASSTVQSIDPATGNATEQFVISGMTGTMNGQPMPLNAQTATPAPTTMTVSPTGQMVSMPGAQGQSPIPGLSGPNPFGAMTFLPTKPVNIGDTWTSSIPVAALGTNLTCVMTLKSVNIVDGHAIAKIQANLSSTPGVPNPGAAGAPAGQATPLAGMNANFSGIVLTDFDIDAGAVSKTMGSMNMDMGGSVPAQANGAAPTPINMHMKMVMRMSLLPPATTN